MPDMLYLALVYALSVISAWLLSYADHFLLKCHSERKLIIRGLEVLYLVVFEGYCGFSDAI